MMKDFTCWKCKKEFDNSERYIFRYIEGIPESEKAGYISCKDCGEYVRDAFNRGEMKSVN
jgi:DNA-directed RNA polymerase subunit RPC12/RpoP